MRVLKTIEKRDSRQFAVVCEAALGESLRVRFRADGQSMQHAAGLMTGMSTQDYRAMMAAGGRRPEGWRSIKEGY